MSNQLLPCPCCGGKPMEMQYDGILWVQCEDCALNTAACDASADYVQLWNRRATQPAAGDSAPDFFVEFKTLRRALSIYGISAPESDHELGSRMERYAIRVIEAVAKLPFPYPPAAAHGDEAVRKDDPEHWTDQQVSEFLATAMRHCWVRGGFHPQDVRDAFRVMRGQAAMRAQAGEGGE